MLGTKNPAHACKVNIIMLCYTVDYDLARWMPLVVLWPATRVCFTCVTLKVAADWDWGNCCHYQVWRIDYFKVIFPQQMTDETVDWDSIRNFSPKWLLSSPFTGIWTPYMFKLPGWKPGLWARKHIKASIVQQVLWNISRILAHSVFCCLACNISWYKPIRSK